MSVSIVVQSPAPPPFDVAAHFTKMAASYDAGCQKVRWDPGDLFARTFQQFADNNNGPLNVVDLGPGTGVIGLALKREFNVRSVVGIDLAQGMLPIAKNKGGIDHAIQGDISAGIPLATGCADVVTLSGVLDFIPDTETLAREVGRILKLGGVFIGTFEPKGTSNKGLNSQQHGPQTLGRDFARAGLTAKVVIDLPGFYRKPGKNPQNHVVDNQLFVASREP